MERSHLYHFLSFMVDELNDREEKLDEWFHKYEEIRYTLKDDLRDPKEMLFEEAEKLALSAVYLAACELVDDDGACWDLSFNHLKDEVGKARSYLNWRK